MFKMFVRPKTDTTFGVKNVLIDRYLRQMSGKLYENKKHSIWEYLLFYLYFVVIIREIVCFNLKDKRTRLILWDFNLFIGGIRQYNTMFIILIFVFGIFVFKYLFFTTDKQLMKWFEILEVISGKKDPASSIFTSNLDNLQKIRAFVKQLYFVKNIIFVTFGE